MTSFHNFFGANRRNVDPVVADILMQRAEFTIERTTLQLSPSSSWLLGALEKQHEKRTGEEVDLSKAQRALLLILELTAYYLTTKGATLVTVKDGFLNELEGACKGAPLIRAYSLWREAMVKTDPSQDPNLQKPEDLDNLLNDHKLKAAKLATEFEKPYQHGLSAR